MNKQQLAAKIWESANKMRSKIEANEYKDYILGFIFYKFLVLYNSRHKSTYLRALYVILLEILWISSVSYRTTVFDRL